MDCDVFRIYILNQYVPSYRRTESVPNLQTQARIFRTSFSQKTPLHLAGEDRRTGGLVRLAAVVVDVDHEAGVSRFVSAGERNQVGGRLSARAAADVHLRARDVELGAAGCARAVQSHMLDPEQVVALGQALRDREVDC